jgi:PPOX class probable F420-dependent enzyme
MPQPAFHAWQLELVEELRVARLATISPSGAPHLVPVCFALHAGTFWVAVDEKPKRSVRLARLRNIQSDSRVSLLLDRYDDDWTRLAWMRIDGEASIIPAGRDQPAALEALRHRYPQYRDMDLESRPLVRIEPVSITAWRASNP